MYKFKVRIESGAVCEEYSVSAATEALAVSAAFRLFESGVSDRTLNRAEVTGVWCIGKRSITLEEAKRRYVSRYTCEHVPAWALVVAGNGRYYAPHFSTDKEWYDNTAFPGEPDHYAFTGTDCHTTGQTWPRGQWLDSPFRKEG